MARRIKITGSNAATGYLELDKNGNHEAHPGEKVKWKLKRGCGVEKITDIVLKSDPGDIWEEQPEEDGNDWEGVIKDDAPINAEYTYSIHWLPIGSTTGKVHDPKITIKPEALTDIIWRIIRYIFFALVGAFAIKLFQDRKK